MTHPQIHALIVHLPIGIILLGCFIEILSFTFKKDDSTKKFSFLIMIIATIFSIVALISGIMFTPELIGKPGELKVLHMNLASGITTTMLAITIMKGILLRKENLLPLLKWLVLFLYVATALVVCYTAFLGNSIVYNYMIGI